MHLHRIPNLAPKFLYFDDDYFLGRPVSPEVFYTSEGATVLMTPVGSPKIDISPDVTDNFQWQALKYTAKTLLDYLKGYSTAPEPTFFYPSPFPYLVHRELLREALDVSFKEQSAESSSLQVRTFGRLMIRFLAPEFLKLRKPRDFDLKYVYHNLLDVDGDNILNPSEIRAMTRFIGKPEMCTEAGLNCFERLDLSLLSKKQVLMKGLVDGWTRLEKSYRRWANVSSEVSSRTIVNHMESVTQLEKVFNDIFGMEPFMFCLHDNILPWLVKDVRELFNMYMTLLYPRPAEFEAVEGMVKVESR
eukprot:TRINITY_DN2383_c0_g1_i2.p1 TRINITY_DN2383_c0_g1~~TRINITY_DN2383_c0_g1_i2.p1  ORF type:complete len:303 (-),score=48.74 TRINITY_DN2383_c0_g1_i2:227-1135(-)